jgi:hypothetical protein
MDLIEPWLKGGVFQLSVIKFPSAVARGNTDESRHLSLGLRSATNFGRICSVRTLSLVGVLI